MAGMTMTKSLKPRGQMNGGSAAPSVAGRQPLSSEANVIDVAAAVDRSHVTSLLGRAFPVQFKSQGALEAWTRAFSHTELWRGWNDPDMPYMKIRREIGELVEFIYPTFMVRKEETGRALQARRLLEVAIGTNLKYHLSKGPVIEATPALETLLTNSDVDLSLPMSIVAPPYPAQYLRFGEVAQHYLKVPDANGADCVFDGVYCFFTPDAARCATGETRWMLELVFIIRRQDSHSGHVELSGVTDRGSTTLGAWLDKGLAGGEGRSERVYHESTLAAVSYVVRVFLYMALKQARVIEHHEYDEALRRAAGLGERKRARLLQRSASLYNSIRVGPESVSPDAAAGRAGGGVAPHWRRGHFRMQPYGTGNLQRKLIFVAPVLIHAEQLQGEAPAPKSYQAGDAGLTAASLGPASAQDRMSCAAAYEALS